MNVTRGFFRLWVVSSALFVMIVTAASYGEIKAEFEAAAQLEQLNERLARARAHLSGTDRERDLLAIAAVDGLERARASQKMSAPWSQVWIAAGIAFGVPIAVLGLGFAVGWAVAGFRQT